MKTMKKHINYSFSIPDPFLFPDIFWEQRGKTYLKLKEISGKADTNSNVITLSKNLRQVKYINGFNTASILLFSPDKRLRIQTLFEIRKRLSTGYDKAMKSELGSIESFGIYALAAFTMLQEFKKNSNFNWMSTALKLNDYLGDLLCHDEKDAALGILALEQEKQILQALMNDFK